MITKRGLVLGATATMLATVVVTGVGLHVSRSQAFLKSPKDLIDEVWLIVDREYLDGTFNQTDWQAIRNDYLNRSYADEEEVYTAIREMLEVLDDPYTRFLTPEEFKNLQVDTQGELTGVGIQIAIDEETQEVVVVAPIEDTPAFEAGIVARDAIVAVDGQSTEGLELNQVVSLIRGKPGTSVTLTMQRDDRRLEFTVKRARIEIHPVIARVESTDRGNLGYIRLRQFSANAAGEMREAIRNLEREGIEGYVLDLRSNPGGLLFASIEIARMWYDEGTIVSTVNRRGVSRLERANNSALTDKPLVVLVDGGSASASEILSGALQDLDRAKIVGTQTFGKGLVQSVRRLGGGSGIAVTIAKYLTPNDRDINKEGIVPDEVVELTEEQREALQGDTTRVGTLDDPQFVRAVDLLFEQRTAGTPSTAPAR